jgi:hypothetical protein
MRRTIAAFQPYTQRMGGSTEARLAGAILRVFRGRVFPGAEDDYLAMLLDEAIPQFRRSPGLIDVRVARPLTPSSREFLVLSAWRSLPVLAGLWVLIYGLVWDAR